MKEIELKAKLNSNSNIIELIEKKGGHIEGEVFQKDEIFLFNDMKINNLPPNAVVLRIREQNDRYKFTLKKHLTGELDCIEKETYIDNYNDFKDSLLFMNYYIPIVVEKLRKFGKLGEVNFTIDDVKGLGKFIELEYLTPDINVDSISIQFRLKNILIELGIAEENIVNDSYDVMLAKKL